MPDSKYIIHQTARLLEESEARYKLLINSVHDYAIYMLDPDGIVTSWNSGAEKIKGYKGSEIMGRHFSAFYTDEDIRRAFPQHELKVAVQMGRFENEGWRVRKDSTLFWANVIITPIYDEVNNLIGFSKVTRDLTERKKLEDNLTRKNEELKESEERFKFLVESVEDYGIFMMGTSGTIKTWNKGAERIKGYKADEIIGKHFSVFYPHEAVSQGFPGYELKKAIEEGRFEDEGWRLRKDGSAFWANVIINPIYNNEHLHIGFVKVTRDLTLQVKNEELMKKNQELLKINTELDNFTYSASHDLKLPIANLEGLMKVLERKISSKINSDEAHVLEMMENSIVRLKKTIADLAEIAKAQNNPDDLIELLSFEEVLAEVKEDIVWLVAEVEPTIQVDFRVSDVRFSKANLKSILYNLVTNAIKYRSPERKAEITITTYQEGEYTVLSVKDNGLGLTKEQKSKLFLMFKRFHSNVEGTGIGLYIIRKIIENNYGRIEVESEYLKGSEFKVYFKR
jgi:PAS domain S-box-containing protein